jgi:hypothetical protein
MEEKLYASSEGDPSTIQNVNKQVSFKQGGPQIQFFNGKCRV